MGGAGRGSAVMHSGGSTGPTRSTRHPRAPDALASGGAPQAPYPLQRQPLPQSNAADIGEETLVVVDDSMERAGAPPPPPQPQPPPPPPHLPPAVPAVRPSPRSRDAPSRRVGGTAGAEEGRGCCAARPPSPSPHPTCPPPLAPIPCCAAPAAPNGSSPAAPRQPAPQRMDDGDDGEASALGLRLRLLASTPRCPPGTADGHDEGRGAARRVAPPLPFIDRRTAEHKRHDARAEEAMKGGFTIRAWKEVQGRSLQEQIMPACGTLGEADNDDLPPLIPMRDGGAAAPFAAPPSAAPAPAASAHPAASHDRRGGGAEVGALWHEEGCRAWGGRVYHTRNLPAPLRACPLSRLPLRLQQHPWLPRCRTAWV